MKLQPQSVDSITSHPCWSPFPNSTLSGDCPQIFRNIPKQSWQLYLHLGSYTNVQFISWTDLPCRIAMSLNNSSLCNTTNSIQSFLKEIASCIKERYFVLGTVLFLVKRIYGTHPSMELHGH